MMNFLRENNQRRQKSRTRDFALLYIYCVAPSLSCSLRRLIEKATKQDGIVDSRPIKFYIKWNMCSIVNENKIGSNQMQRE